MNSSQETLQIPLPAPEAEAPRSAPEHLRFRILFPLAIAVAMLAVTFVLALRTTPADESLHHTIHVLATVGFVGGLALLTTIFLYIGRIEGELAEKNRRFSAEIDERERTEAHLRESQSLYQALVDHLPANLYHKDAAGRFVFVNARFCEAKGRSADQLLGQFPAACVSPEVAERDTKDHEQIMLTGQVIEREETRDRPDGTVHYLHVVKSPVISTNGHIVGSQCIQFDVTSRKLAELKLRLLTRAVDQSSTSIVITDRQGRIEFVNPCFVSVSGYSTEAAIGQNPRILKSGKHDPAFYSEMWATISAGRDWNGEIQNRRKNGELYWERSSISPVRDEAGTITHFICVKEDITKRKHAELLLQQEVAERQQAEAALAKAHKFHLELLNHAPALIWRAGTDAKCDWFNATWLAFTGRTLEQEKGDGWAEGVHPDDLARCFAIYMEAFEARRPFVMEYRLRRHDGSYRWILDNGIPSSSAERIFTGYIGYCFDITDRKQAERELLESRSETERSNTQLQLALAQAKDLALAADSANRAKSAFLASMSHELRTPLNAIIGTASTLRPDASRDDIIQSAALILESGQSLLGIIEEILDYSGLQAGKTRLDPKPFSLLTVVNQSLRLVAEMAKAKNIRLSYWISPRTPASVNGDCRRIQQILLNLLSNALKFTDHGQVHLSVTSVPLPDDQWKLAFAVTDTGRGISREGLSKLFQPFSRLTEASAPNVAGTGLGLVISRSFAQLMGGDICAHSKPGRGTTFRCTLVVGPGATPSTALAAVALQDLKGRRLLILDTDRHRRRLLAAVGAAWGLEVFVSPHAHVSEAFLQTLGSFDLAVLGVHPGDRDLGEAAHWFSPGGPGQRTRCLWLGASGETNGTTQAKSRVGAAGFIDMGELALVFSDLAFGRSSIQRNEVNGKANGKPTPLGARLPLRILAADDIRTNREMLRRLMAHLGYQIDLVANGVEVLAAMRQKTYDLVLLDVQMPVMDGLTAARNITRLHPQAASRPKMIALTANALPGDRETCFAAGMDDYLTKPVLPHDVENSLLRLFSTQPSATPPATPAAKSNGYGEQPLLDEAQLASVFHDLTQSSDLEALLQLQEVATADYRQMMAPLKAACQARDQSALAEIAHGLKGCFLSLGWSRISAHCAVAVDSARRKNFDQWETFPEEVDRLFILSSEALDNYVTRFVATPALLPGNPAPAEVPAAHSAKPEVLS